MSYYFNFYVSGIYLTLKNYFKSKDISLMIGYTIED